MTRKTRSGFHLNQQVRIAWNWRTEKPDSRVGIVKKIWRRYFYSGGSVLMVLILLDHTDGKKQWVETEPQYLEAV